MGSVSPRENIEILPMVERTSKTSQTLFEKICRGWDGLTASQRSFPPDARNFTFSWNGLMKIRHVDYHSMIVEISKEEFQTITGKTLGDKWGNGGIPYNEKLQGKEFPITQVQNNFDNLNYAVEQRNKICGALDRIKESVESVLWPIEMVKPKEHNS